MFVPTQRLRAYSCRPRACSGSTHVSTRRRAVRTGVHDRRLTAVDVVANSTTNHEAGRQSCWARGSDAAGSKPYRADSIPSSPVALPITAAHHCAKRLPPTVRSRQTPSAMAEPLPLIQYCFRTYGSEGAPDPARSDRAQHVCSGAHETAAT